MSTVGMFRSIESSLTDAEKSFTPNPPREHELTYQQREAEIERADGEVLLMVDADVEKSGAHFNQYKMADDGKVTPLHLFELFADRYGRQFWFLSHLTTQMIPSTGLPGKRTCSSSWLPLADGMLTLHLASAFPP
jgi:hypothetical protein